MKVGIGNDHTATAMKNELVAYLEGKGYEVVNYGTDGTESIDYPVFGRKVAEAVASGEVDRGIAICGTGVGIGIAASKVKGTRVCTCSDVYSAIYSRLHNDANVITFGARVIGIETAKMLVDAFLENEFEGGRHARRVGQLMDIEKEYFK